MAQRVDDFPADGRSKYAWNEWLDGNVWKLVQGEDFTHDIVAMRSQIYIAARGHGGKARVHVNGDSLYFQFFPESV